MHETRRAAPAQNRATRAKTAAAALAIGSGQPLQVQPGAQDRSAVQAHWSPHRQSAPQAQAGLADAHRQVGAQVQFVHSHLFGMGNLLNCRWRGHPYRPGSGGD